MTSSKLKETLTLDVLPVVPKSEPGSLPYLGGRRGYLCYQERVEKPCRIDL